MRGITMTDDRMIQRLEEQLRERLDRAAVRPNFARNGARAARTLSSGELPSALQANGSGSV
jgi:hypothetical protein